MRPALQGALARATLVAVLATLVPHASCISLGKANAIRAPALRLRGGAMAMFWGSNTDTPAYPPLATPAADETATRYPTSLTLVIVSGASSLAGSSLTASLGWRVVLAGSYCLFFAFTALPGRLDTKLGKPKREDGRFFTPSGWAFAIWGPIFLLEMVMAASAAFAPGSLAGPAGSEWLQQMAPCYAAAALHQVVWTLTFREWALDKLWIPALNLTLAAFGLSSAHGATTRALAAAGSMSWYGYAVAAVPIGLHFGWMCCAAVLSWNNVLNAVKAPRPVQLAAATFSCYGAAALLGHVSFHRRDPIPALVGWWALWAVSTGHEVLRGAVDNLALDALNLAAKASSWLSLLAAAAAVAAVRFG